MKSPHCLRQTLLLLPLFVSLHAANAAGGGLTLVNTSPEQAVAVAAAARVAGLAVTTGSPDTARFAPGVVVWEARSGGADINDARAARLREWVRRGGRLLITLSDEPGTGPFRLAEMLPTSGWKVRTQNREETDLALNEAAPTLFATRPTGFHVPNWYEIRPVAAVERGQERYDIFERPIPYLASTKGGAKMQPAGTNFWTRSLLSRDWQIRARGAGVGAPPLLITGRYGAGRVAVFAASVEMPDNAAARAFWTPVMGWLSVDSAAAANDAPKTTLPPPTTQVDVAGRALLVTLRNPTAAALPIHLLGRVLTWERAYVADSEVDATLPAGGTTTVRLPLPPAPGPTAYQALAYRDAYQVRLGVLSQNGADLLSESKAAADLRPAVTVAVSPDPARGREYPFHAPLPYENESINFYTLGLPLSAYAYAPGATAHVTMTIANGLRNIAPLAVAKDESNPTDGGASALNDETATAEKGPSNETHGWTSWEGTPNAENVVSFTFPHPVTVAAVTLLGAMDDYRKFLAHNPAAVTIEADGKIVAHDDTLTARFPKELGRVRIPLSAPLQATVIRLRFPANPEAPRLGDVEIDGSDAESGAVPSGSISGTLTLTLTDPLTGHTTDLKTETVTMLASSAQQSFTLPVTLPAAGDATPLRLDARFTPSGGAAVAAATASAPILVLEPKHPLLPMDDLRGHSLAMGFIVTRGFRNVFDTGTGTQDISGWEAPDDLVWAFAHGMKQLSVNARTEAGRLYVSENDFRHYSTPWRTFNDGEDFYDVATPLILARFEKMKGWDEAKIAHLGHSDRWDAGPDMASVFSWQDFEAFNTYLIDAGLPGLTGKTREELSHEVETKYASRWKAYHLQHFVGALRNLHDTFAKEGKTLTISSQGFPLVPPQYQDQVAEVERGMGDDSTWGMVKDDVPMTTGRQMAVLSFAPDLKISTTSQWGYDSGILGNPMWHCPVGTTEPSRRTQFDRAFRGLLRPDGTFMSQYTYGYGENALYAYTMNANDCGQWMRVQEKESLLTPDAPFGAGLVVANGYLDDPNRTSFAAGGNTFSIPETLQGAHTLERLHDAGVSLGFSANASTFDKWPASNPPIVLVNAARLTTAEAASLQKLIARGVRVAAFTGGDTPLPAATAAALTGALLVPLDSKSFSTAEAAEWAGKIVAALNQPIAFPPGTAGYGFRSAGRNFVVVEDWREEGRTVAVRYRPGPGVTAVHAADASEHTPFVVHREGDDYVIDVPMRPGDGVLIALEETK